MPSVMLKEPSCVPDTSCNMLPEGDGGFAVQLAGVSGCALNLAPQTQNLTRCMCEASDSTNLHSHGGHAMNLCACPEQP